MLCHGGWGDDFIDMPSFERDERMRALERRLQLQYREKSAYSHKYIARPVGFVIVREARPQRCVFCERDK